MPYPTKALQEYLLKSEVAGVLGGIGLPGPAGQAGADGAVGSVGLPWQPVESATAPLLTNGDTIVTAGLTVSRVAPAAPVTGVIMQPGTIAGQRIIVLNQSAFTIQFADAVTSLVSNGLTSVVPSLVCIRLLWNSVTGLWYPAPGATGATPGTGIFDTSTYDTDTYN